MAKITLDTITSSYSATSLFQSNFTAIEDELNDKVLYRDNPTGEANQMENDLDMNSNDILNVDTINTDMLRLGGVLVTQGESVIQNTFTETEFTNAATQDTFSVTYTVGFIVVVLNGVELAEADFTATNGTSVVLAAPLASANDILKIRAFGTFAVADNLAKSQNLADVQSASVSRTNLDVYSTTETDTEITTAIAAVRQNKNKNLLINGDFSVNQRAVSGTVVLTSGEYGHDRFKAGSGGCTYTFATSAGVTTLTITAGTLQQVVEATDIPASDVILSWTGTAQGRIDAGAYGDTGLVTDTTTGGTNFTVEFDTGTLSNVQLEFGDTATDFEFVNPAEQLARCQRYFERLGSEFSEEFTFSTGPALNTTAVWFAIYYTPKRAQPSLTASGTASGLRGGGSAAGTITGFSDITTKATRGTWTRDSGTHAATDFFLIRTDATTSDYVDIDAEL